jgi:sigma-54 dependent transcriptional regulator, acetoin dehydrogenase operon transcriptional activator AcoR
LAASAYNRPMSAEETRKRWQEFAVDGHEFVAPTIRTIIADSWLRSRELGVDPLQSSFATVEPGEFERRKGIRADLREAAVPYLMRLYQIIKGSGSLITLTDEDGVVLDLLSDEEMRGMENFPCPGSIHSEAAIGTSGIGTALVAGLPLQILAEEHWLRHNHSWSCSSSAIRNNGSIIGCLSLSCPSGKSHEHSLGVIVASVNAIERELALNTTLREKQALVTQQKAILELMDTGIILIDAKGCILQANQMARDILSLESDWAGHAISEIIPEEGGFLSLIAGNIPLNDREIPILVKNRHSYLRVSTEAIKSGSDLDAVLIRIREPKAVMKMVNRIAGSRAIYSFKDIIGKSPELIKCISFAKMANRKNANILLLGDSGTGKELFAQAIHNDSSRKDGPFVAINCGALSRELIQSELFGYDGGAFTGAKKEGNPGKFELADGGTLFLDEIGELPLEAQVNLLRILQTGEVMRISGRFSKSVDVRVITATNRDLYKAVEEKMFRDDLFYRINTFALKLPSLKDRHGDIRILADTFLRRFSQDRTKAFLRLHEDVYEMLERYSWPGNIRELENVIERAIAVAESDVIMVGDLPANLQLSQSSLTAASIPASASHEAGRSMKEMENDRLMSLIDETGGNLREVARRMGVARSTVYHKLSKISVPLESLRKG